jgi:predicted phage terminase large subunit-like protein
MTEKEFDQKLQTLINSIKQETTLFPDDNKKKQRHRLECSEKDLFYFAKTYFPHYIRAEFGEIHHDMHEETEKIGQITAIAAFRSGGKTTLLSIIKPIWKALHEQIFYNIKISISEIKATARTAAILAEFQHNARLIHDYGNQLLTANPALGNFQIKTGCLFLALGYQSGLRGALSFGRRPDYIDIDDLEDHMTYNPDIAAKKLKFVMEEAYGAFEKGQGILIWLGNLTHQKSALNGFKKLCTEKPNPFWKFLLIPLLVKDHKGKEYSSWPEHFSIEDINRIRTTTGELGFQRHFQMKPIVEGLTFKSAWFKYWQTLPHFDRIVTYCDPSLKGKETSDYKAILTLGMSNKYYYLIDAWIRKASINQMLYKLYDCDKRLNARLYMESNMWQAVLWDFIPEMAKIMGYILPVSGIDNRENKQIRIERLQPLFEWERILFPPKQDEDLLLLIDMLTGYPSYGYDDGPDALSGAIERFRSEANDQEYQTVETFESDEFKQLF